MIVFDTNKETPFFFIHIPQTITYSNFSNFKWLGKFHHGDGGETIPLKNTCKNKVSPPPPGDGGETLPALAKPKQFSPFSRFSLGVHTPPQPQP